MSDSPNVHEGAFGKRPEPPSKLTPAEAEVWRATVASENVDFFKTDALRSLLVDYCRHTVAVDIYSERINKAEDVIVDVEDRRARGEHVPVEDYLFAVKTIEIYYNRRERESKAAADKATKLRLTNQSRYTPKASATATKNIGLSQKPWDAVKSS